MSKINRRDLIVGAAIAPLAGGIAAPGPADHVLALARTWIAERATADALMARWSDLEAEVMGKARERRRALPQTREMRAIDRQLKRLLKKLSRDAERISPMRATSCAGALAKIEMALAILEPVDVEEHSWSLVVAGFSDLTRLAEAA